MGYAGQLRAIEEARDASEDPEEELLEMTRAYVRFALGCPDLYQVMYGLGVVSLPVGELRKEGEKIAETIAEVVGELLRKNGKPVEDVRDKVTLPWATLHGLLALRVSPDLPAGDLPPRGGPEAPPENDVLAGTTPGDVRRGTTPDTPLAPPEETVPTDVASPLGGERAPREERPERRGEAPTTPPTPREDPAADEERPGRRRP